MPPPTTVHSRQRLWCRCRCGVQTGHARRQADRRSGAGSGLCAGTGAVPKHGLGHCFPTTEPQKSLEGWSGRLGLIRALQSLERPWCASCALGLGPWRHLDQGKGWGVWHNGSGGWIHLWGRGEFQRQVLGMPARRARRFARWLHRLCCLRALRLAAAFG